MADEFRRHGAAEASDDAQRCATSDSSTPMHGCSVRLEFPELKIQYLQVAANGHAARTVVGKDHGR
jgi:hypothetical protein